MAKRTYFEELKPFGNAIGAVVANIPRVSGNTDRRTGTFDDPALEDKLAKQAAKQARRAARAGHKPCPPEE